MTATLNDQTRRRKRPEPSAEAKAAAELVRAAKEQGLSLTGPDGLLKQLTKTVLESSAGGSIGGHPFRQESKAAASANSVNASVGTARMSISGRGLGVRSERRTG